MTDIVDDLREYDREVFSGGLMTRAADEIERLREALEKIASYLHGGVTVKGECSGDRSDMILMARAALKGQP